VHDAAIRFDRGTLVVDDVGLDRFPSLSWDPRTGTWRAPAHRLAALKAEISARGRPVKADPSRGWEIDKRDPAALTLREYQSRALVAWTAFGRRGVVVLPTGAGKTRLAIAAIMQTGLPAAVLCPTRALAALWVTELERFLGERVGLIGDGERRLGRITVMTFESAYRVMDFIGDRFGLLVVDEVHHFGGGVKLEALEASPAVARLGLTATAPPPESTQMRTIESLMGPIVFELSFSDLVGRHLSHVTMTKIAVRLDEDERARYDRDVAPFREMARQFRAAFPGGDYASLAKALGSSPEGRRALVAHGRAMELASFPRAKRKLVRELLARHRDDKSIVFTAFASNAYVLARDNLVPVISSETQGAERREILQAFREGRLRTIASARVLNEGIDVPDARVALIVAGTLGPREHVQRIGRVLRPSAGKTALVYELVTAETSDETRAKKRGRHAPRSAARHSQA